MMPIYIGLVYLVLCSSPFLDSFAKTCLWVTWDITIQRNSPHQSGLTETLRIPAILLSFTMTPDIFLSSQQQWFISFRPEECTCLLVPLAIYFFWSDVSCSVGYFCAPPICITGIVSCSCPSLALRASPQLAAWLCAPLGNAWVHDLCLPYF